MSSPKGKRALLLPQPEAQMLPSSPPAALSKARRAATAAAAHLLPSINSLILEPSVPSSVIPRRRIRLMPQEDRAPRAAMPPHGRSLAVAAGSRGVGGEVPALLVVSFYRFADFNDHVALRRPLKELCEELRVSGGIILAPEGINGSICGTPESVEKILNFIQADNRLKGLRMIQSPVTPEDEAIHHGHTSHSPVGAGEDAPFRWDHVRVKLKKEVGSYPSPLRAMKPAALSLRLVFSKGRYGVISDCKESKGGFIRGDYKARNTSPLDRCRASLRFRAVPWNVASYMNL